MDHVLLYRNPVGWASCIQPAPFVQSALSQPSALAPFTELAQEAPQISSYGIEYTNPFQRQSTSAEAVLNDIEEVQQNPLSVLANGLTNTESNGVDLEKLKDRLSDAVADAIVRYKSIKASPVSASLLQNANSIYRNMYNNYGFQRGGVVNGGQLMMGDGSNQKQTFPAQGSIAKPRTEKESENNTYQCSMETSALSIFVST